MIGIAINQAAFDALASTLPLGSVAFEPQVNERGERLIWLEPPVVGRLRAMRGASESYSDVIMRLIEMSQPLKPKAVKLLATMTA